MPEMRDHREISVAGDMRSARPTRPGRRPPPRTAGTLAGTSEWRAMLGAVGGGTLRIIRANPGTLFGVVAAIGAVAVVSLNALGHQAGRHPAPILPKVVAKAQSGQQPAKAVADASAEPTRAADAPRPPVKVVEAARPPARTAEAAKPPRDAIGDLIRAEDTTASVTPKAVKPGPAKSEAVKSEAVRSEAAKPETAKPQPEVMQAQKALAKLGYGPLKADGMMGASTRAAIERFERDRKLPVKGEAAGRTLRELAARAALPPA